MQARCRADLRNYRFRFFSNRAQSKIMKTLFQLALLLALTASFALPVPRALAAQQESCSPTSGLCWPVLKLGSRGEKVVTLQTLLKGRGLRLKIDGKFGASTQNAVRIVQKQRKLRVDGIVGYQTWSDLTPYLERGARGETVRRLQVLLNRRGEKLAADGFYGAQTADAARRLNDDMSFDDTPAPGEDRKAANEVTWCALLGGHFDGE